MRKYLYTHRASQSGKLLANAIGAKRIRRSGSKYRQRESDLVINWGSSGFMYNGLNSDIGVASNKLSALNAMSASGVPVPAFTSVTEEAAVWLEDGHDVVCRSMLRASGGRGITVASPDDGTLPPALLYTHYIKKLHEYRVHVVLDDVIDVQRKMLREDYPRDEVNWKVRNLDNGFIYGRGGVEPDTRMKAIAKQAVQAVGLDFGAVDIIYNEHYDMYYVLEVNTAPGLTGTTLEKYADKFNSIGEL